MMNKLAQDIATAVQVKLAALSWEAGASSFLGGLGGAALGASVGGGAGTIAGIMKGIRENNQLKNMGLLEKAKRYLNGEQTSRTGLQNFGHVLKRGLQGNLAGAGIGGLGGGALGGLGGTAYGEYLARKYPNELGSAGTFSEFYTDDMVDLVKDAYNVITGKPTTVWTRVN